jgi:hypothetical protein
MSTNQHRASLSNEENATTAARIYSVNDVTVRTALRRNRERDSEATKHNKILSEVQVEAIYKYVEDSYGCLKATNQVIAKSPLTWRWFHP